MATKKLTRKELKQEDQFIKFAKQTIVFVKEHKDRINLGVMITAVVAILISLVVFSVRHSNAKAAALLNDGWKAYDQAIKPASQQQPQEALDDEGIAKARDENLKKSIESFSEVVSEYSSSSAAPNAMYLLANAYYRTTDYPAAAEHFGKFLAEYPKHTLVSAAKIGMAYCQEAQGKFPEALTLLEEMLPEAHNFYSKPQIYIDIARVALLAGQTPKSVQYYKRYLSEFPDGASAEKILNKLAEIAPEEAAALNPAS